MTKHFYRAEVTLDSRVSLLETVVKHRLARRKGNSFRIKRLITNGGRENRSKSFNFWNRISSKNWVIYLFYRDTRSIRRWFFYNRCPEIKIVADKANVLDFNYLFNLFFFLKFLSQNKSRSLWNSQREFLNAVCRVFLSRANKLLKFQVAIKPNLHRDEVWLPDRKIKHNWREKGENKKTKNWLCDDSRGPIYSVYRIERENNNLVRNSKFPTVSRAWAEGKRKKTRRDSSRLGVDVRDSFF